MQKVNFNIISRDDWEVLSNKQFGYFYFVVDDVEVLDAGGDLYLGENLIGSGLTIEEIVEYFENPANEHTFPGVTAGDLMPRGDTDIEITERLGIAMQNNKRHIKSGSADLVSIEGIRFDYNEPSTVLKYGIDLGGYQSWEDSPIEGLIFLGDNHFIIDQMIEDSGSYNFVFPVVKGVAGKYGVPELGQNNGYVVVGGKETYVGWCSFSNDNSVPNFSEMEGVRLEGQPSEDTHVYYIPEDNGVMCVRYASQPSVSQDGTITVDGVEVGCHLAMDNKKDDVAGKSNNVTINFGDIIELSGIGASDSGLGASDTITVDGNNLIYTRNIDDAKIDDLTWNCDDGEYDPASGNYIYHFIASVDGMKPDGAIAVTGGTEQEFIDAYSNGTNVVITGYGDENDPFNRPTDDLDYLVYELATPVVGTLETQYPGPLPASKYGIVIGVGPVLHGFPKEIAPFVTIRYQQSGADQIWNAIAYQKEMAEVTAAALNDLNNRIENVDVDLSPVYAEIEEVAEVTAAALNDLNGRIEDVEEVIESLEDIPQWEGDDSSFLTFVAEEAGSTISITNMGSVPYNPIECSLDGGHTWRSYSAGNTIILENVGGSVKFKGSGAMGNSTANYRTFNMTGSIAAYGDVTSLVNGAGGNASLSGKNYCFYSLFSGCNSLTHAPNLPSTTLANYCYYNMFINCSSLTTAPELPATTLAQYCYQQMFHGCTSLVNAPELPATTLATSCYYNMFANCTALATAPELPATALVSNCYNSMFRSCSKLNYIKAMFTTTPSSSYTYRWVEGVASTGTFVKNPAATWTDTHTVDTIPFGWDVDKVYSNCLKFTSVEANSNVTLTNFGGVTGVLSLQYSTDDGASWSEYSIGTQITIPNVGGSVKFKGVNHTLTTSAGRYYYFGMTGKISASGDVTSLLNGVGGDVDLTGKDYCFYSLFRYCAALTQAPNLPSTKISDYCYYYMFSDCNSLTTAPELPATTLAPYCYQQMFDNCGALVSAQETLPATTLAPYCYYQMFQGCNALTTAPEIQATIMSECCCDSMFKNCTSLTTAPELPATTLAPYCYQQMFFGCNSLVTAQEILPANTLTDQCYYNMFFNCTALTTAPELPATTLAQYCYSNMFRGCTALTTAPVLPATTLAQSCYQNMFNGCTALTSAQETLPATTLAQSCYQNMFLGCTALTTAPELPATTLVTNCYKSMFQNCSNLNYIKAMFTTTPSTSYTNTWVSGVAATGTFVKNSAAQWDVTGANGIPTNWTIQTADE